VNWRLWGAFFVFWGKEFTAEVAEEPQRSRRFGADAARVLSNNEGDGWVSEEIGELLEALGEDGFGSDQA